MRRISRVLESDTRAQLHGQSRTTTSVQRCGALLEQGPQMTHRQRRSVHSLPTFDAVARGRTASGARKSSDANGFTDTKRQTRTPRAKNTIVPVGRWTAAKRARAPAPTITQHGGCRTPAECRALGRGTAVGKDRQDVKQTPEGTPPFLTIHHSLNAVTLKPRRRTRNSCGMTLQQHTTATAKPIQQNRQTPR